MQDDALSGFDLFVPCKEPDRERARRLVLKIIRMIDEGLAQSTDKKGFLNILEYYAGMIHQYVLYALGLTEGDECARNCPGWMMYFLDHSGVFLDHPRTQGDRLVAHPYDMRLRDVDALVSAVKSAGLDMYLTGSSEYFPGSTFKVVIYRPESALKGGRL